MKIDPLGELHRHADVPEWWDSGEVDISLLEGQRHAITFADLESDARPQEFEDAVRAFLSLSIKDRDDAGSFVYDHYKDFVAGVGKEEFDFVIEDKALVWQHVHPSEILVSRRTRGDKAVYVSIAAECDWEAEHGLQIVFKQGKTLKRVSAQDGHLTNSDAHARPELEDVVLRIREK